MRKYCAGLQIAIFAAFLGGCQSLAERPQGRQVSLAISNVTVIDPETRQVLPRRWVIIDGGYIVAVLSGAQARSYPAARTVDGSGRFLVPGLMDMHAHLFLPEPTAPTLNLLLANGVTGIREMSGDCWEIAGAKQGCIAQYRALQKSIKAGETPGPELLSLASTMVMGPQQAKAPAGDASFVVPRTPDEGRRLVRHLKERGVDLIKTHDTIPDAVFTAIMDEAGKLDLEVSGHVPFAAGALGAAALGYGSIEHARDLLYDCSRYGPEYRRLAGAFAEGQAGAKRPKNVDRLQRTVEEFDAAACTSMLQRLSRSGTFYVPTHVTREMEARAGDLAYRSDGDRKYVLPDRQARWEKDLNDTAAVPAEEARWLRRFFEHGLRITRMAYEAGVPIMAGTDLNDTMIVPGFSLHRELSLLAAAGIPPMDVLRAATAVPAAYLGMSGLYGGISTGKEADLVLLSANPLDDVANTGAILAVVSNGKLMEREELDSLLRQVEGLAARPPA